MRSVHTELLSPSNQQFRQPWPGKLNTKCSWEFSSSIFRTGSPGTTAICRHMWRLLSGESTLIDITRKHIKLDHEGRGEDKSPQCHASRIILHTFAYFYVIFSNNFVPKSDFFSPCMRVWQILHNFLIF